MSTVVKSQLNQHAYLQRLDIRWLKEKYIAIGTLILFYLANYVLGDEMVTDAYQWELIEDGQVKSVHTTAVRQGQDVSHCIPGVTSSTS